MQSIVSNLVETETSVIAAIAMASSQPEAWSYWDYAGAMSLAEESLAGVCNKKYL